MSLGEIEQVAEGICAYLQPDGSWYLNNTGFLVGPAGATIADATSTERGTPVDLARALGDMVAYNGSHPLTCHA
jgi:cyclase